MIEKSLIVNLKGTRFQSFLRGKLCVGNLSARNMRYPASPYEMWTRRHHDSCEAN